MLPSLTSAATVNLISRYQATRDRDLATTVLKILVDYVPDKGLYEKKKKND